MSPADPRELVIAHLRSPRTEWSIGAFGAIAEFHRDPREPAELGETEVTTGRGAVAVRPERCRAFAYEILSARSDLWLHGVALCLPESEAGMNARARLTELGPDREALRTEDHGAALFDLGLGLANCDFCVRAADPALQKALRAAAGTPILANEPLLELLKRSSPHRVLISRLGRVEVFQRIGVEGGLPPAGPHTHLLPKFIRQGRTHAANIPIPAGWRPCVSLYPPNPVQTAEGSRRALDRVAFDAFAQLLERFGDPEHVRVKREVTAAVRTGEPPDRRAFTTRRQRAACRIALRQLRKLDGDSRQLARWLREFDVASQEERAGAH